MVCEVKGAVTPDEAPAPRGMGERILLVDDDEFLAELGRATLAALGYVVEIVNRPEVALDRVRANPLRFRLVLTDQTMPVMTGLELADELRRIRPDLPVILMTGYSNTLTPGGIEAAGIREVLRKPATLQTLAHAVHAALSLDLSLAAVADRPA